MTVNDFLYLLDDNGTVPVPVRFCVNSIHIDADSQPRVEILHFYYTVPSLLNIDRSPRLQNFKLLISVLPTILLLLRSHNRIVEHVAGLHHLLISDITI